MVRVVGTLFGWVGRLVPGAKARAYRRRGIFTFHDGRRRASCDPCPVYEKLNEVGGATWPDLLTRAAGGGPDPVPAADRAAAGRELARIAREAFGVPAVGRGGKAGGLTDAEAIDVLIGFLAFCRDLNDRAAADRG